MTVEAKRVELYEDAKGEHRWRAKDTNGRIVADSGEGYVNRSFASEAAHDLFPDAVFEEADEQAHA